MSSLTHCIHVKHFCQKLSEKTLYGSVTLKDLVMTLEELDQSRSVLTTGRDQTVPHLLRIQVLQKITPLAKVSIVSNYNKYVCLKAYNWHLVWFFLTAQCEFTF